MPPRHPVALRQAALLQAALLQAALLVSAVLATAAARAEPATPWAGAFHGGGRAPEGRLAGIEIALDPGYKTYWREPGESGLPPALDWAGSQNLGEARIAWPAPRREEDAGGVAYAYEEGVTLPVVVTPADPAAPVRLRLALEYGICREICIPAKANLALYLPAAAGEPSPALARALAAVPRSTAPGETADGLAVVGAALRPGADGHPAVAVSVRAPAGASLFVEAPAGFFLLPPAVPAREGGEAGLDAAVFAVPVLEAPPKRPARLDLTLTLTAPGRRAIETRLSLDSAEWPR